MVLVCLRNPWLSGKNSCVDDTGAVCPYQDTLYEHNYDFEDTADYVTIVQEI